MDFPYIALLLLLLFFAYREWKYPQQSNYLFRYACWVTFIFIAFRAPVVGADTWDYYRYATGIRNFYNADSRELEPLYQLYNDFFRNYCPIGVVFMSVNTIIIFAPIRYILKKYCKYKTFGILTFFLIYNFSPFFVALRQILALSIILWGVIWVIEDKKYKWAVFIALAVIAWFVHTTAAVVAALFVGAYFMPIKLRIIPLVAICVSAMAGIILRKFNVLDAFWFIASFDLSVIERISIYLENQELNDSMSLNIVLRDSVIAILIFSFLDEKRVNHWFSKMYLLGVVLFNLFCSVPMINRMIMSNTLFVIVIFPWLLDKNYIQQKKKQLLNILLVIVILYFTRSYILSNAFYDLKSEQRMHPYYFFFQDYHTHPSILYFK